MDNDIDSIVDFLNDSNIKPLIRQSRMPTLNGAENARVRPKSLAKTPVHPIQEGSLL